MPPPGEARQAPARKSKTLGKTSGDTVGTDAQVTVGAGRKQIRLETKRRRMCVCVCVRVCVGMCGMEGRWVWVQKVSVQWMGGLEGDHRPVDTCFEAHARWKPL